MKRRDFLLHSAMLAAALSVRPAKSFSSPRGSVLVVGAGMAGISAARRLVDSGFEVTILEARNEPGGRIRRDMSFGVPLDLGAQFITTSTGNPLTALAKQYNADLYNSDDDDVVYANPQGEFYDEEATSQALALYSSFRSQIDVLSEELDRDIPIEKVLQQFVSEKEQKVGVKVIEFLRFLAVSDISGDYAADPSEYSTRYFEPDGEYSGPDLLVKSSYRVLIDGLARGLHIQTGVLVHSVAHSKAGVILETSKGRFTADRVLVTVPLGVLKRDTIKFSPPLPNDKLAAISRLGMGLLDKLYLKFPRVFWQNDEKSLGYMGNVPSLEGREYPDFYFLDRMLDKPIMLLFIGGSDAREFEKLSADECVARATKTLKRIFGSRTPEPEQFIRTSWGTDSFAFGSYSFTAVNSTPRDHETLAQPVGDRLFFAGEATERHYPASVHGAYLSGIREAERIASL